MPRMTKLALGWTVLLGLLFACSDDGSTSTGEFGSTCSTVVDTGSTECDSGVCTDTFDQIGHPVCSLKCTVADPSVCPAGADGTKKCNMKGYCKP
jgi:hypothetical protein